ncbi:cytochrome c oxidase subunit II [Microvirga sp. 2MCAF38]|uniref:cytochrome c oxidase subunit II n=1 Tax=Microvirga sp. 2MCAF38 TaxID=3232989 RepID=UPI003F9CEB38
MLSFLMPEAASTQASETDAIYLALVGFSLVIVLLVAGLIIVFSIRYRRSVRAERGPLPVIVSRELEIGWTVMTLFIAVFIFWWAASARLSALPPPPGALEIHVVARQWMWKTQHSNGAREINELHVPIDRPVRLVMTSQDAIHSFFVPAFRIKQDVLPGRYTETWFQADKLGSFHLLCAEYCGTEHSRMIGRIVVLRPEDYGRWLSVQPQSDDFAREGEALFVATGCAGCHALSSKVHAPKLTNLYGHVVQLSDGRSVTANDAYIRDSILQPNRDIVAGYEPIMQSFAGILSDGEIQSLTAYIRSLSVTPGENAAAPGQRSPAMVPGGAIERPNSAAPQGGQP